MLHCVQQMIVVSAVNIVYSVVGQTATQWTETYGEAP